VSTKRKKRGFRPSEQFTRAQRETLLMGRPGLNISPPETFRGLIAWRDTPEAEATWREHREELIEEHRRTLGGDRPCWGELRFDSRLSSEEIDRGRSEEYFESMAEYGRERDAIAQAMARKLSAGKRRGNTEVQ